MDKATAQERLIRAITGFAAAREKFYDTQAAIKKANQDGRVDLEMLNHAEDIIHQSEEAHRILKKRIREYAIFCLGEQN